MMLSSSWGRDDVLGDLQAASGFRVSTSGFVEGFALCLGDLTAADCSSCLAYAVGKLKSLCGSAAAGDDVMLGIGHLATMIKQVRLISHSYFSLY